MKKLSIFLTFTVLLSGCWEIDRTAGVSRCKPKPGFENAFPTYEVDPADEETTLSVDLILGPQSATFRDRISGKLMTIGVELDKYYNCTKIEE